MIISASLMQYGNSVIIHNSPIIQHGLKNILLSRNIGISDIMNFIPEYDILREWNDILILVDIQLAKEIKNNIKVLKKNGNSIIGIESYNSNKELDMYFDEIININDQTDIIVLKINDYISRVSDTKSNNQLSSREIELLTMVAQGLSNKQIADQLFISIHTVITHRKNITSKLGIKSISGLTLYAALNNMVDLHQ